MKEHPILFSAPMVRAILDGRKTQTRRVVKPQPDDVSCDGIPVKFVTHKFLDRETKTVVEKSHHDDGTRYVERIKCPYGQPGDRLWVREAWIQRGEWIQDFGEPGLGDVSGEYWKGSRDIAYKAEMETPHGIIQSNFVAPKWRGRPSIHMPRWASRITLEIDSVCVERLHDITEEDATAEGIEQVRQEWSGGDSCANEMSGRELFEILWESINGPKSWDANPWVWSVEFHRINNGAES